MAFGAMTQVTVPELDQQILSSLAMSEAAHAILDSHGRCLWLSKGFWRIVTQTSPPYWPMDFLPASFPADLRSWICDSSQSWQELSGWLQQSGKTVTLERARPDQHGSLEWHVNLLSDHKNFTTPAFWLTVHDISARQVHDTTRSELVQRYELALQGSFDGLWEWNVETGHVWLSPRYHELMGCDYPLPATPSSLFDFIIEEDRIAVADQLGAFNHGRLPRFEVVCRIRKRNGELRWLLIRANNQRNDDGRLHKIIGAHTDITQLILAEQILLDAIEGIQDGFALFSTDDKLLLCNERYIDIYPYSRGMTPLIGRSFEDMLREGLQAGHFADELALSDPELWLQERLAFHQNPSGPPIEQKLADGRWILIRERRTKEGGIVGIRSDITALKQREIELARLADSLEQEKQRAEDANAAKTSFLATISHELRTPMTGVIGMVDLLRTTPLTDEQNRYAELLQRSARSMMELLNDMLDLSKIEAGRLDLEIINMDLYHLVRDVIDLFRPRAEEKRIGIGYHFDRDVPNLVRGDPTRLRQILFNLVSNAVKFTPAGSVQIKVHAQKSNSNLIDLHISVIDTGIGMTPDQIEGIFEPFQQAELSTTRRFGGSGLGLAICKKLVEAMDGEIQVHSEIDKGTEFTVSIRLPLAEEEDTITAANGMAEITVAAAPATTTPAPLAEPVVISDNPPPGTNGTTTGRSLNILLAEDNQTTQLLVRSILDRRGHRVICVPNGKAALEAIQHNEIDVILMDSYMPDMDGATATRMIRALPPPVNAVPVYALTADVMPEKQKALLASGMNGILAKPIDWTALDQTLAIIGRPLPDIIRHGTTLTKNNDTAAAVPVPTSIPLQPGAPVLQKSTGAVTLAKGPIETPKGIDRNKWQEIVDLLGPGEAKALCLHGILDAEEMVSQIGDLLDENLRRPGRDGRYFQLLHTLSGLLANIGANEWATLSRQMQQDNYVDQRLEWLEIIREGLTQLYDSLQN